MRNRYPAVIFLFLALLTGCQNAENQSAGESAEQQNTTREETLQKGNQPAGKSGSIASSGNTFVAKKFWDNRFVFFKDFTGESSAVVYDAIKGQKYFDNTYIFVYATLEDMEGTSDYSKIEETVRSTNLDDRIFIWVHLNAEKEVLFVRKLISDNIKDTVGQGTKEL